MSRILLDSENRDTNNTPLRGDHPRFHRTGPSADVISIRPWLARAFRMPDSERPKKCTQELSNTDVARRNGWTNHNLSTQLYPGDRFIPLRRGYSFEAAHHLLRKQISSADKYDMDFCKQIDLLDVTYRREAMCAIMLEQGIIPGLNQNRILRGPVSSNLDNSAQHSKSEGERRAWKCAARKKRLIGKPMTIMSIPYLQNIIPRLIDWSCRDMVCMSIRDGLAVNDNNGMSLMLWHDGRPNAIRWSNDGTRIACTFLNKIILSLYSLEEKKRVWSVACGCVELTRCTNKCICWSHDDRRIVIGCNATVSVYASDSGKLIFNKFSYSSRILTLSLSPNSKYLISSGQDRTVQMFAWPDMVYRYDVEFAKPIKAVAWHPEESDLLCMGTKAYRATLALWNVKTCEIMDYLFAMNGSIENLAWNKLSGELVVHWSYQEDNKKYNVLPILSSFRRIVDAVPLDKKTKLSFLNFNSTHEKLGAGGRGQPFTVDHWPSGSSLRSSNCDIAISTTPANWFDH